VGHLSDLYYEQFLDCLILLEEAMPAL